jgi:hypothetical protein
MLASEDEGSLPLMPEQRSTILPTGVVAHDWEAATTAFW